MRPVVGSWLVFVCGVGPGFACAGDDGPSCACFSQSPEVFACATGTLCPQITVQCAEDVRIDTCPADQLTTDSAAAIDCTLAALVDGAVGEVSWSVVESPGYHQELSLSLVGDGTAFRWSRVTQEPDYEAWPAVHLTLESEAYFRGCTALATPGERFVCLREGQHVEPFKDCSAGFFGKS